MIAPFKELLRRNEEAKRHAWWQYIGCICAGRRYPSQERVNAAPVAVGTRLQATDRVYLVTASGAYRKVSEHAPLPAHKSQIRLLPKPDKSKYNKFTLALGARPATGAVAQATIPEAAQA